MPDHKRKLELTWIGRMNVLKYEKHRQLYTYKERCELDIVHSELFDGELYLYGHHSVIYYPAYSGMNRPEFSGDSILLANNIDFEQDITVFCGDSRLVGRSRECVPEFIVEIQSLLNTPYDISVGFTYYSLVSNREYWVVDPAEKTVEAYINR